MEKLVKVKFYEIQNLEFLTKYLKQIKIEVTANPDHTVTIRNPNGSTVLLNSGETYTFDVEKLEVNL